MSSPPHNDDFPYVLYYDHVPSSTNPLALAVLSHWFPSPFSDARYPDVTFPTAEHYIMYRKAVLFDPSRAADVLASPDPARAQAVGRELGGFDRAVWAARADEVAERTEYAKFSDPRNGWMWELLKGMKGELVEASPTDRVWGIGFGREQARGREEEWGENRAGKALGRARERLLRQEAEGQRGAEKGAWGRQADV
ncbi:hypothetical protein Q5752_001447 [Cryptotrichosporon argae]